MSDIINMLWSYIGAFLLAVWGIINNFVCHDIYSYYLALDILVCIIPSSVLYLHLYKLKRVKNE